MFTHFSQLLLPAFGKHQYMSLCFFVVYFSFPYMRDHVIFAFLCPSLSIMVLRTIHDIPNNRVLPFYIAVQKFPPIGGQSWGLSSLFPLSHGSLSFVAWCPMCENYYLIQFILFEKLFQVGKLNPGPFPSSWLEAEVSCAFFLFGSLGQLSCLFPLSM